MKRFATSQVRRCVASFSTAVVLGAVLLAGSLACDGEEPLAPDERAEGHARVSLSGAEAGEFESLEVWFDVYGDDQEYWTIGITENLDGVPLGDFSPRIDFNGLAPIPSPGTYDLVSADSAESRAGCVVRLMARRTVTGWYGQQVTELFIYRAFVPLSGTLTIASRTSDEIVGQFDFEAGEWMFDSMTPGEAVITVTGDFRAVR